MSAELGSHGSNSAWEPGCCNFKPYREVAQLNRGPRRVVSAPIAVRLTRYIVETYKACNPNFAYSTAINPKRYLTNPSDGVQNDGFDNKNSDLILAVNDTLINEKSNFRYVIKDTLGHGTFGQVVKCWADHDGIDVAVKVIKNQPAYYQQALVEIQLLRMLNQEYDPEDNHNIVRILDFFVYKDHLCIAFELLSYNLFDLLKQKTYKGISLQLVRLFTKQILAALGVLRDARVIHCDLKPENILLSTSIQSGDIKLIDFGSACTENRTVYSYIQSRFYRSPEVVLGHPYTTAIDMWSLGCVAAELFLGLPLFPGDSEYDLLQRMIQILGCQPGDHLLRKSKNWSKYFKNVSAAPPLDGAHGETTYRFLNAKEYESRENEKPAIGKKYFKYERLEDIIKNYPFPKSKSPEAIQAERSGRIAFVDFLRGLLQFDPARRWTPRQATLHPFITEEPYTGPYQPMPDQNPLRIPVSQMVTVDHHPTAGHWFTAGLSPQVMQLGGVRIPHGSPQYPFSYASSYGSCEGIIPGSYGSYSADTYLHSTPPQLGYESWRRIPPGVPPGYGLGMSPSNNAMKPMSLGGSPSQYTPPGSQFSSPGSPSSYGPTSPARLGKAAHFNRRRGFTGGSSFGSASDGVLGQRPPTYDGHPESYAGSSGRPPHGQSHLKPAHHQQQPRSATYKANTIGAFLAASETIPEAAETSCSEPVTDWGDWDPNYGMLLQEEGESVLIGPAGVMGSGGARLGPGQGYGQAGFTSRDSELPYFQASPQLQGYHHGYHHHHQQQQHLAAFASPQYSSFGHQYHYHQSPQHHHPPVLPPQPHQQPGFEFQQPPLLSGRPSGGFTAGFQLQRPPSTTEPLDRRLTGILLSSGQV